MPAHNPHTWQTGEVIQAATLNKLETDLAAAAVVADVGTAGTPTGDALRAAYGRVVTPEAHGAPTAYAAGHDDTAAVQAAINDAVTSGVPLAFSRVYNINAAVTATGRLIAYGTGAHDSTGGLVSGLLMQTDAVDGLVLSSSAGSALRNFGIKSAVTTPTAGAALRFTGTGAADFARLTDLAILNCYDGLSIEDGTYYKVRGVDVFDPAHYGMHFATSAGERFDHGDQTVSGCTISAMFVASRNATTAVRWESGGGLRFIDNKINGKEQPFQANAGQFTNGLDLAVGDGTTVDLLVTGNSIENCTGTSIQVRQGGSLTGTFRNIVITGNEVFNSATGIALSSTKPQDTAETVGIATITGNIFTNLGSSITLSDVYGVRIGPNVHFALSGPAIAVTGTNSDIEMDPQTVRNDNKVLWHCEDNNSNGHTHLPTHFELKREVPPTTSTTTYSNLYRLSVPIYSSGFLTVTIVGNVNGIGTYSYQANYSYHREGDASVSLNAQGTPIANGAGVDVLVDAVSTPSNLIVKVKLASGSGGVDMSGSAVVVVDGPLYEIVKGA